MTHYDRRLAFSSCDGWLCFNILDLHFVCRNIEKEISFDFGTSAEFSYLYNQCYEMTTSEYVHSLTLGGIKNDLHAFCFWFL